MGYVPSRSATGGVLFGVRLSTFGSKFAAEFSVSHGHRGVMHTDNNGQPIIPEPDGDDERELFTFVGFVSFLAQGLEAEVTNLAVGLRAIGGTGLSPQEYEDLFVQHERRTLGSIFVAVRAHITLPIETEYAVSDAIDARNRLVHHFFRIHAENFMSATGRREMIAELRTMARVILTADALCSDLTDQLWASLGVSEVVRAQMVADMAQRALDRDTSL